MLVQKISAGAGAVYLIARVVYALGYYSGGKLILSNLSLVVLFWAWELSVFIAV